MPTKNDRNHAGRALLLPVSMLLATGVVGFVAWQLVGDGPEVPADVPADVATGTTSDEARKISLPSPGASTPRVMQDLAAVPPSTTTAEVPAASTAPAAVSAVSGRPTLDPERWSQLRELLHHKQDAATRLSAARQILDDETAGPFVGRALEVLAQLDPTSVAGEIQRLLERDEGPANEQQAVANALVNLSHREALLSATDLAFFFENGSDRVRIAAAAGLARRGDESLAQRYQELRRADLAAEDPRVRIDAVRSLAEAGARSSMHLLLPLLEDDNDQVRSQVLGAIRRADDPSLVSVVRQLVDDPSPRISSDAKRLVESLERRQARDLQREQRLAEQAERTQRLEPRRPPIDHTHPAADRNIIERQRREARQRAADRDGR